MTTSLALKTPIAFIGGGNMASAIIGGLIRQGHPASQIEVVEPWEEARTALRKSFAIEALPAPGPALARAGIVVWAVKPQTFKDAAAQAREHTQGALHLGSDCIVRTMPNTPALVGKGMSALYARAGVNNAQRQSVEAIMATTGDFLWVESEKQLDAVTALSGSGPAYVFYFLEAMARAGTAMGLSPAQAHQLAVGTFVGASELARRSDETPEVLRQRVTSKGGTTYAAIQSLEKDGVGASFEAAMRAAEQRAHELGNEFGA
jgi:pyrroline-5-carboxylate reductase